MAVVSIVDSLDCFAEDFKGISLHGSKIKKAEFEACTFVSATLVKLSFYRVDLSSAALKTVT